jgi:hypothetical protein
LCPGRFGPNCRLKPLLANAHREIELWPENPIEAAFLETMGADASKGQPVTIKTGGDSQDGPRSLLITMGSEVLDRHLLIMVFLMICGKQ